MIGMQRFLSRVEKVFDSIVKKKGKKDILISKEIHLTVKSVTEDIETFKFNTAISRLMSFFNTRSWAYKLNDLGELEGEEVDEQAMKKFLILLSPFAPHLAEELWHRLGHKKSIHLEQWPQYDASKLQADTFILVVMINGKKRDDFEVPKSASQEQIRSLVLARPNVKKWTDGKTIAKELYVKEKIYTIVVH
jgi:leucyl-tRNA synthetase